MQILGYQKRLLCSIRCLGQLINICPELATLPIVSGFKLFWEVVEILSKAVHYNFKDLILDVIRYEGVPQYYDLSVQFTHGWPISLIHCSHVGFLNGNISCTAKATNIRIHSMTRDNIMAFVSTAEFAGVGVSMAELLYYRKAGLQCDQRS